MLISSPDCRREPRVQAGGAGTISALPVARLRVVSGVPGHPAAYQGKWKPTASLCFVLMRLSFCCAVDRRGIAAHNHLAAPVALLHGAV